MRLARVPVGDIDAAWISALPLIERIVESSPDITLAWLWSGLRGGTLQLWLAGSEAGHVAAQVTRLEDWRGDPVMRIIGTASDDSKTWFPLWPAFVAEVRKMGAVRIVFDGRKGWARKIPQARILRQVYEVTL